MTLQEKIQEIEACIAKAMRVLRELKDDIPVGAQKELITTEDYNGLLWELDGWPDIVKAIYKNYNIHSLQQILRSDLPIVKVKIKEIKKTYENYVE